MATSKKNSELFDAAFDSSDVSTADRAPIQGRRDTLTSRTNALAKITAGDLINRAQQRVDPARCRLWEHHNRQYELLNEQRCADLIEGIKAQGGQEFPAIVRAVKNDPEFDFEVICGARRHWSISWLREHHYDFKFLVEVRDLTDEEAFRLSDIENRNRDDISDYERAMDYKNALKLFYKTQTEMAERLEVKLPWLSRYLDLADLPKAIVGAYADVTHIKAGHVKELKPILKDRKSKEKLLAEAKVISENRAAGEANPDGTQVVRLLKSAVHAKKKASPHSTKVFKSTESGKPMLEVSKSGDKTLVLKVALDSGATADELIKKITSVVSGQVG